MRLAEILAPGMTVLDVGCGTGAITHGIARAVGPTGQVIGVDYNPELIAKARHNYEGIPGLSFETGDIYRLPYQDRFHVVTCARVLQWLADPGKALGQMVQSARSGGTVLVLDYNHEKIEWHPQIPEAMVNFYAAFLRWRKDAGMDNKIADHLAGLFEQQGLSRIRVTAQHETALRGAPDFDSHTLIWAGVASFKGVQMVQDGYMEESERAVAEEQYRKWAAGQAEFQKMYLLSVEGIKP